MSTVEQFVEKIFEIDCKQLCKRIKYSADRTVWYRRTQENNETVMFVPGLNTLRVNQAELDRFLAAVDAYIHLDSNDKRFDWDNLNLYSYSGNNCATAFRNLLNSFQQGQLVAADTETRYLAWDDNKLLAIGFATDANTCHAFYDIPESAYPALQEVLSATNARFCWHNGKFDKKFLQYTCGLFARVDEDTMLKHFAQVSEKKGTHGLKYLAPLYLQAPQWDDELEQYKKTFCRKNKIKVSEFTYDMIPTEILIPYMQRDCIASYRLLSVFDELKEPGTDRVYDLLIRATEAFSCMEINGATVDNAQLLKLKKQYTQDLEQADEIVSEAVRELWNPKRYAQETGAKYIEAFNLHSPKQLKWMLKEATGIEVDSADAATVEKLTDWVDNGTINTSETSRKFLDGIMLSRKASKYLDTYVIGMQSAKRADNRVSGVYNLHGTETGRLSSSSPKQNWALAG